MQQNDLALSAALVGLGDIRKDPIDEWQSFLSDGKQYLATARNGHAKRRLVFTPEILYNLIGMGIEKLIMALLMKSGNLPYNHTMHDLVEAMDEFLPGSLDGLQEELKALDGYQEICDPYSFRLTAPTKDQVEHMLELAGRVQVVTLDLISDQ